MGHQRLVPSTKKWKDIVSLLCSASAEEVAEKIFEACDNDLEKSSKDTGFKRALYLLVGTLGAGHEDILLSTKKFVINRFFFHL